MALPKIATIKIHPSIGIARLGNSPSGFFIGPEKPGVHQRLRGGYRDSKGRVKRQAARFRLYAYDSKGKLLCEITSREAHIEWTVHLANTKAEWKQFNGLSTTTPRRNLGVADRGSLMIDPGARTIIGRNRTALFNSGKFLGHTVKLGEIRSDSKARLLVLGGFGNSSSPTGKALTTFANNDGWHDDVSDGPVKARVRLKKGGKTIEAAGAWVIAAPPSFAPAIDHVVTLYDVLLQVAVDKLGLKLPAKPSFVKDILPILQRAIRMRWVSGMITHPPSGGGETHTTPPLVIPPPGTAAHRKIIFDRLRDPATPGKDVSEGSDMPMIHSDFYPAKSNQPVTRLQYEAMRKWKDGKFIDDWKKRNARAPITPEGLDRAGLDTCVGGAFYPGIEASWMMRDVYTYKEPFRLDPASLKPGDITKQMAVPWQADFTDCAQDGELAWWPAARPDDVFPEAGGPQAPWIRDIVNNAEDMVKSWYRLGFIVEKGKQFLETERRA
ncbi:MAG TPA: LodA/GoxA family CTQ-dependent oxidase [Candidatus Saccharimonadales bacterium]|jgi:hypothetical protein|nr:LodA/GoxA family CTQ-dependent oxidase [Candidatus Saccharimonadales bacterium]